MRDYGKVAPQFWTGQTGKALKAAGPEAVIVAVYLMTSPHANMIGLYYLPKLYIAHETGLDSEGACKGLARAIEAGFCSYDEASEHVFVHAMARFQIAEQLSANDKRCKGVENELSKCPQGALVQAFRELYGDAFHLPASPETEAPSKPLRSQEQEQEQEQEKELQGGSADAEPPKPGKLDLIPYQSIVDAFNERLTGLAKVRSLTNPRKTAIRSAWNSLPPEHRKIGAMKAIFAECALDDFLNGNGPYSGEHANWRPDFDHLIKLKTVTKVYEKAMARRERMRQTQPVQQSGAPA